MDGYVQVSQTSESLVWGRPGIRLIQPCGHHIENLRNPYVCANMALAGPHISAS